MNDLKQRQANKTPMIYRSARTPKGLAGGGSGSELCGAPLGKSREGRRVSLAGIQRGKEGHVQSRLPVRGHPGSWCKKVQSYSPLRKHWLPLPSVCWERCRSGRTCHSRQTCHRQTSLQWVFWFSAPLYQKLNKHFLNKPNTVMFLTNVWTSQNSNPSISDEPPAPTNLQVTGTWSDSISLSWEPPKEDGGQPLLGYLVEKRESDRPVWVKTNSVSVSAKPSIKVAGLFEGSDYFFRVFSVNSVGPSKEPIATTKSHKAKIPFGKWNFLIFIPKIFSIP